MVRISRTSVVVAVLALLVVPLVFAYSNPVTKVGHSYSELQSCPSANQILKTNSTKDWVCASSAGTSGLWEEVSGSDDIYYTDGNVGIGTVSPLRPLHINSSAGAQMRLQQPNNTFGWNYIEWYNSATREYWAGVDNAERFRVNPQDNGASAVGITLLKTGSVGVGNVDPGAKVDISNRNNTLGEHGLIASAFYGSGDTYIAKFDYRRAGDTGYGTRMVIRTDGRVGIGTSSPSTTFHTVGEIHTSGSSAGISFNDQAVTSAYGSSAGQRWKWYSSGNTVRLWTPGTGDVLTIDSSGKATFDGDICASGGTKCVSGSSTTGDNLGNHVATKALDMGGYAINSVGRLAVRGGSWTTNGNDIFLNTGANGQKIYLRPNGDGVATGEMAVDSSGNVDVSGSVLMGYEAITVTESDGEVTASCTSGKKIIGGGCDARTGSVLVSNLPTTGTPNGWYCRKDSAGAITATAICARIGN